MLPRMRTFTSHIQSRVPYSFLLSALIVALALPISSNWNNAFGQDDGGTTDDTIGAGFTSGVSVDADGVLRGLSEVDATGRLSRQRIQEAVAQLDSDIAKPRQAT